MQVIGYRSKNWMKEYPHLIKLDECISNLILNNVKTEGLLFQLSIPNISIFSQYHWHKSIKSAVAGHITGGLH